MASSAVEKLKEQLAAEVNQKKLAAERGLELLQENKRLKVTLQKQTTNHETVVGEFLQQIHNLSGRLDAKENELKILADELDASKETHDNLKRKLADNESELHRQLAALEKDRNGLEFINLEKDAEISTLKKTVKELEERIREITESCGSSYSDDTNSIEQSLFAENQVLAKQKTELEEKICEFQQELFTMREKEEKLKSTQKLMEEELAYWDSKLKDSLAQKHQIQEENEELRSQIETMKLGEIDTKRRGNSLFAEVEDNRKALENEVKSLRSQKIQLVQKDEENQQEIRKMKYQITMLLNMCDQKVDSNYVQKLTQDLRQARGEVEELTAKLILSTEKLKVLECSNALKPVEKVSSYNSKGQDFMVVLIEERDREIEKLQSELKSVNLIKTSLNNRVIHAERQLYLAEKGNDGLKSELMRLKLDLEGKEKKDLKPVKSAAPKVKTEKIPGFLEKNNVLIHENVKELAPGNSTESSSRAENKENEVFAQCVINEVDVELKKQTKKVQFSTPECAPDRTEKREKHSRAVGNKTKVSFTMVSSENAPTPDQCAQQ